MDKTDILMVGDFDMSGTGYQAIQEGIAFGLMDRCNITILGTDNRGAEHSYPFKIIPTHNEWIPQHIIALQTKIKFEWIYFFMDIPRLIALLRNIKKQKPEEFSRMKIVGVFPVEALPLDHKWALEIEELTLKRFTFTDMGVGAFNERKVQIGKLPVGLSPTWYTPPTENQLAMMKDLEEGNKKYVISIAANLFRKNLPDCIEAVAKASKLVSCDLRYVLITTIHQKDGWKNFEEICERRGLDRNKLVLIDANVSETYLRYRLQGASVYLNLSYAEGIGIPLYQSQACGCPVIAVSHTGAEESVVKGKVVKYIERMINNPWGGVDWLLPDLDEAAVSIAELIENPPDRTPIKFPSWKSAADILYDETVGVRYDKE